MRRINIIFANIFLKEKIKEKKKNIKIRLFNSYEVKNFVIKQIHHSVCLYEVHSS